MSATVTYKGATLTTATNQTRTLDTAGTYLEDDITITDVTTIPTGTKNISITANGTTTEDVTSYASASITANVPNSYSASDEGKVVSNGALVSQTAHADVTPTTSDQTINTTTNNSIKVKGDADLIAGNIKKDVEIFGVIGSYEGGGGTPTIGTHKVELGQYTPTATGNFSIVTDISRTSNIIWACVWLADASVLSNYSSANIMTFSGFPISGGMRLINMWQSGTPKVEIKSAYGLRQTTSGAKRSLYYDSHANWPGQPETYNYMAVYD